MKIKIFIYLLIQIFIANINSKSYLDALWNLNGIQEFAQEWTKKILRDHYNENNHYRLISAYVRMDSDLDKEEKDTFERRKKITQKNLQKFLNNDQENDINIALCTSGGGYRALVSTLGFLSGLEDIGLLDCIIYHSSLSGSSWALGSLFAVNFDIKKFTQMLLNNLESNRNMQKRALLPRIKDINQIKYVSNNLVTKYLFDQPITSVDLWGTLIINDILDPIENRQNLTLSKQKELIKEGLLPIPIYSAVKATDEKCSNYYWIEFTPYESSLFINKYFSIPSWAFGRKFNKGTSIPFATYKDYEYPPETSLSYIMGICGSAYTVDIRELSAWSQDVNLRLRKRSIFSYFYNKFIDNFTQEITNNILDKNNSVISYIENERLMPAEIFNFTSNMEDSIFKQLKKLTLIDAGIYFNLPFPPLLRKERNIDLILTMDVSDPIINAPELLKAEIHARKFGFKFPRIKNNSEYKEVNKKTLTIFSDDKGFPTIIYFPLKKDPILNNDKLVKDLFYNDPMINKNFTIKDIESMEKFELENCKFCSTFNFTYSKENFKILFNLMRFNVIINREKIKAIINNIIEKK